MNPADKYDLADAVAEMMLAWATWLGRNVAYCPHCDATLSIDHGTEAEAKRRALAFAEEWSRR